MAPPSPISQLESIIWPRYKENAERLAKLAWSVNKASTSMDGDSNEPPAWFLEIVFAQTKGVLNMSFHSPQPWLVLPEPLPGLTMVVHRISRAAIMIGSGLEKIPIRYHSLNQFCELSGLVEKALGKVIRSVMKANSGDVVELANEDGSLYIFPHRKMTQYLLEMGFPEDQIKAMASVDDIETDFFEHD